jgi:type IV secretory pathway VirB2 component (pilin)
MNPEIKAYLDEHGATYTPEALRRALVDAGHDPATVDLALREWQANRAGSDHSKEDRRTFGRWAFALHLGALVAMFALVVLLKGTTAIGLAVIAAVVLGIALLIGWAISSLIGRALLPRVGLVIALVVPLISALALSGTCVALMNASIPTPPRNGSLHLQILPPRTFDRTGMAACYLREGGGGVEVNSQELGTLDGKGVGVNLAWYGNGGSTPKDL